MTQRITYAKSGDRLSARFVNRLVDGANAALQKCNPPRSLKLSETSNADVTTDAEGTGDLEAVGTLVYEEISRTTSLVQVEGVDIDRIDTVTLQSGDERITLVFDNT